MENKWTQAEVAEAIPRLDIVTSAKGALSPTKSGTRKLSYAKWAVNIQCELNEALALISAYEEVRCGRTKIFPDFHTVSEWLRRNRT